MHVNRNWQVSWVSMIESLELGGLDNLLHTHFRGSGRCRGDYFGVL